MKKTNLNSVLPYDPNSNSSTKNVFLDQHLNKSMNGNSMIKEVNKSGIVDLNLGD